MDEIERRAREIWAATPHLETCMMSGDAWDLALFTPSEIECSCDREVRAIIAALTPAPAVWPVDPDTVTVAIMERFRRMGGLEQIMTSSNYVSRIHSTIWLGIYSAMRGAPPPPEPRS